MSYFFDVVFSGSLVRCLPDTADPGDVFLVKGQLFKFDGTEFIEIDTPCKFLFFDEDCFRLLFVKVQGCHCLIKPVKIKGTLLDCIKKKLFRVKGDCWEKLCDLCDTRSLVQVSTVQFDCAGDPLQDINPFTIDLLTSMPEILPESDIPPGDVVVVNTTAEVGLEAAGMDAMTALVLIYSFQDPANDFCDTIVNHIFIPISQTACPVIPFASEELFTLDGIPSNGSRDGEMIAFGSHHSVMVNGAINMPNMMTLSNFDNLNNNSFTAPRAGTLKNLYATICINSIGLTGNPEYTIHVHIFIGSPLPSPVAPPAPPPSNNLMFTGTLIRASATFQGQPAAFPPCFSISDIVNSHQIVAGSQVALVTYVSTNTDSANLTYTLSAGIEYR